jgi:hypothetical protein
MTMVAGAPARQPTCQRRVKQPGGPSLTQDTSRQAKQVAAAILEVLAGARTPQQAAEALTVSLPRYYQLESRALRAVVVACEARPKGRVRSPASELAKLKAQYAHLQREVTRQQALVRATQRSVGLAAAAAPTKTPGKKTRQRRPVARALSVVRRLRQDTTPKENAAQQVTTVKDKNYERRAALDLVPVAYTGDNQGRSLKEDNACVDDDHRAPST